MTEKTTICLRLKMSLLKFLIDKLRKINKMSAINELKVTRVRNVKLPSRGTPGSAGLDVYVPADLVRLDMAKTFEITKIQPRIDYDMNTGYAKNFIIGPNEEILIPTGLKINVPDGYVLKVENKSSISSVKSLLVGGGIVDSDYEGEILVNLHNTSDKKMAVLNPNDKMAQLVLYKIETPEVVEIATPVDLFKDKHSVRGDGGFGSTGAN